MTAATVSRQPFIPVTFVGLAQWVAAERARVEREQRARLVAALPWLVLPPPEFCNCDACDLFPDGTMRWGD
jgi:hypothetical protein